MAESSACLLRSFSNPSSTSSEEQKVNPLQRALTTSISFGRFMSESLDWEKWSAFTQNRHLEEAEKYSKPGSVAEKKAYFEAHFKRRRAAALTAANFPETKTKEEASVEDVKTKGIGHLENDGCCFSDIVSRIEEKDGISSLASSEEKPQIKPVQLKNSEKTPQSKSKAMNSNNKRSTYTTSLHMSINFGANGKDAVEDPRAPVKKYKNRASANGVVFKHENSRIMRPISRATTVDDEVQPPSSNHSKSSRMKTPTPTVPSSFMFKSEERAVKRREKLEQKVKKEEEKHQMHAKPQTKARSTGKDLRNSIALETTKNANLTKVPACLPKIEERPAFKVVQGNETRPPWRNSNSYSRPPSFFRRCFTKKSANENASPNIQL